MVELKNIYFHKLFKSNGPNPGQIFNNAIKYNKICMRQSLPGYHVQSLTKSPPAVFKGFYILNFNGF